MKKIINYILKVVKLFPELFALPIALVGLSLLQKGLLWMDSTNTIYQDDWIQTIVMSLIGVMVANFAAHGAIKYNQTPVWEKYKAWLIEGGEMPLDYFKLLALYNVVFGLIIIAII